MAKNNYYTDNYETDYTKFGGYVYNYDYNGYNSMAGIAERIISDWKFDEKCRKNIMNRKDKKIVNEQFELMNNLKENKLTYSEYKGCRDILTIDLHNNYTIIAIKSWVSEEKMYKVEFRITENSVDKWDYINELESVEFNVDFKIINKAILKHVATLLSDGFFNYYIQRYEYELKCFDVGNKISENERLGE